MPGEPVSLSGLWLGWTTLSTQAEADALAATLVEQGHVACAQIDGPITSHYRWQGRLERAQEWRLLVKFPKASATAVREALLQAHPYETPQWYACAATDVAPGYAQWVAESCTPSV